MTRETLKLCLSLILLIFMQLVDMESVKMCNLDKCEGYKNFSSCTCLHIEIVDCEFCPKSERIEEYSNDKCLCSENGLKKQQLSKDLCYRYHQGSFKCPISSDPKYAIYFDERTCKCMNISAYPCGGIVAPCKPPYSWYKQDNYTLCLCTALFKCSQCLPVTIIEDLGNDTCICRDLSDREYELSHKSESNTTQNSNSTEIVPKNYNNQTNYCYLYSKKLFACPKFHDPLVKSEFNNRTCTCEILIAEPCSETVAPCVAPYYWYEGDNKINCACVTQRPCSHCDDELILEEVENDKCICQRPKSDDVKTTAPNQHPVNEKCALYRNGSYFCPIFDSMLAVSYFNETTCECETTTADECSLKYPTCDEPYHWYNNDTSVLCLCVHKIDCEDCLDDRIVENFKNGTCLCRHLSLLDSKESAEYDFSSDDPNENALQEIFFFK